MSSYCLISILAILVPYAAVAGRLGAQASIDAYVGFGKDWQPIKNINDPHVRKIAEFTVRQYNIASGNKLILESVLKGETSLFAPVSGEVYRLVMAIKVPTGVVNYETVVYEDTLEHSLQLLAFYIVTK